MLFSGLTVQLQSFSFKILYRHGHEMFNADPCPGSSAILEGILGNFGVGDVRTTMNSLYFMAVSVLHYFMCNLGSVSQLI